MDLWIDLLFGNPVGLFSVVTIGTTFIVIVSILVMIVVKSRKR
jgi:hypothetical protein